MASFQIIETAANINNRKLVSQANLTQTIFDEEIPRLVFSEKVIVGMSLVDNAGAAVTTFLESDTWEAFADVDFIHSEYEGTANAGYSGAVTSIVVNFATDPGTLDDTGGLIFVNDAFERERVPYSAQTGTGTTRTFTVASTLDYVYLAGDFIGVEDPLMVLSDDDEFNIANDWAELDVVNGKISFRIDTNRKAFQDKVAAYRATNGNVEDIPINLQINRYGVGETKPTILVLDQIYAKPAVRDIEGSGNLSDQSFSQADARYQLKDGDAVANNVAIFDASGNSVDSGVTLQSVVNALEPQGAWNASTNTPDIANIAGLETGWFWIVSTAGTTNVGGITDWEVNDWAVKTATGWAKADHSETGKVKASSADATPDYLDGKVDDATIEVASDVLQVKALGIDTAQLAADAVETAKIADANVTLAKLASASVNYTKHVTATSQALTDNSTTSVVLVPIATYQAVKLQLAIREDADTDYMQADVIICHDGTNAVINTVEIYAPSAGNTLNGTVTFSADIDTGNLRLGVTLTSLGTTATMKYKILDAVEVI